MSVIYDLFSSTRVIRIGQLYETWEMAEDGKNCSAKHAQRHLPGFGIISRANRDLNGGNGNTLRHGHRAVVGRDAGPWADYHALKRPSTSSAPQVYGNSSMSPALLTFLPIAFV
jgi:hypothetical protein